mgnify:FL=1
MAGGLFGRPFVLNIKCIVFSVVCMILFLYKPEFSSNYVLYFTLFVIFVVAYVAMAWYDYFFNCDILPLKRGTHSVTSNFKPPAHEPDKQIDDKDTPIEIKMRHYLIYATHIIVIAPLLLYIGIYRKNINPLVYPILVVLALMTAGYHGSKALIMSHS